VKGKLESKMSVPKSFIDYMKIMRENYKSGASNTIELPIDFNFDDTEIENHLYGFVSSGGGNNTDKSYNTKENDLDDFECSTLENEAVKVLFTPSSLPKKTDIITIKLFDQDGPLINSENTLSVKAKAPFTLIDKINNVLSKLAK
jgi:hypothetical protein